MAYFEGEIPVVTSGNGNNNGFGLGNGWEGIIGLLVIAGLFGGNWGGFGGNRGGYGYGDFSLSTDFANIERKLDGVNNGLCDGFYAQNTNMLTGFSNIQQTLCQGFNGLERSIADVNSNLANSICTLGYQNQAGFNSLANQIASCCCDLKTMNLENRYLNERQTCNIIEAINAGNQRLVDIYTNDKIEALRAENVALKGAISDERLGDKIISKLSPCPSPAFIVPNPNCCYNYTVTNAGCCGASVL